MISFLENFGENTPPVQSFQSIESTYAGKHSRTEPEQSYIRARRNDPQTSKEAGSKAARFSASHAGRIHLALIGKALTAHELAPLTGLTVVQIDRRLPELRASGMAEVVQADGVDLTRGGFRVWRAA